MKGMPLCRHAALASLQELSAQVLPSWVRQCSLCSVPALQHAHAESSLLKAQGQPATATYVVLGSTLLILVFARNSNGSTALLCHMLGPGEA
jgi:hypothetical protein